MKHNYTCYSEYLRSKEEYSKQKKVFAEHEKLIQYRNHLQSIACTMDKNTIEYNNVQNRILKAHTKAYAILKELPLVTEH